MRLMKRLWSDESGAVLSAEVATVASVVVVGSVAGLSSMATSINAELTDLAKSFRSLDQSYSYSGFCTCRAHVAGSCYRQEPVEKSLHDLCPIPQQQSPAEPIPVSDPKTPVESPKTEKSATETETPADEKLGGPKA